MGICSAKKDPNTTFFNIIFLKNFNELYDYKFQEKNNFYTHRDKLKNVPKVHCSVKGLDGKKICCGFFFPSENITIIHSILKNP